QMPPPMPPPPPVTNATLPSSLPMLAPRIIPFDRLKFRRVVHQQHLAVGILVEPLLDRLVVRELLLPMDILLPTAGTVVLACVELQRCAGCPHAYCLRLGAKRSNIRDSGTRILQSGRHNQAV